MLGFQWWPGWIAPIRFVPSCPVPEHAARRCCRTCSTGSGAGEVAEGSIKDTGRSVESRRSDNRAAMIRSPLPFLSETRVRVGMVRR